LLGVRDAPVSPEEPFESILTELDAESGIEPAIVAERGKDIARRALESIRSQSDVAQSLWGCYGCGYLVEGDRPDTCPICGALAVESSRTRNRNAQGSCTDIIGEVANEHPVVRAEAPIEELESTPASSASFRTTASRSLGFSSMPAQASGLPAEIHVLRHHYSSKGHSRDVLPSSR
jgi:hypothetical protein